jgi:hypothetical protein
MQNGEKKRAPTSSEPDDGSRLDWKRPGLAPWQRRVTEAVMEAVLADEDDRGTLVPGSPAACARATAWMDDSLGRSSNDLRRGFVLLSFLMEWLPLVILFTPTRMTRLPLDRRVAYLEALESSRVGLLAMLLVAFKVPLSIPAFEEGDELAETGFDRPTTASRRRLPVAAPSASPELEAAS